MDIHGWQHGYLLKNHMVHRIKVHYVFPCHVPYKNILPTHKVTGNVQVLQLSHCGDGKAPLFKQQGLSDSMQLNIFYRRQFPVALIKEHDAV